MLIRQLQSRWQMKSGQTVAEWRRVLLYLDHRAGRAFASDSDWPGPVTRDASHGAASSGPTPDAARGGADELGPGPSERRPVTEQQARPARPDPVQGR